MATSELVILGGSAAGNTEPTAAQRVLGLPELLEKIILDVTPVSRAEGSFLSGGPHPKAELFVLQRVSKTFQTTIAGSRTLQERMFLRPQRRGPEQVGLHHTIDWLLGAIGIYNNGTEIFGTAGALSLHRVTQERSPQFKRPEASWRKIQAHCLRNGGEIVVKHFGWEYVPLCKFRSGEGMTLGRLHDGLQALIPYMVTWGVAATARHAGLKMDPEFDWDGSNRKYVRNALRRLKDERDREDIWE